MASENRSDSSWGKFLRWVCCFPEDTEPSPISEANVSPTITNEPAHSRRRSGVPKAHVPARRGAQTDSYRPAGPPRISHRNKAQQFPVLPEIHKSNSNTKTHVLANTIKSNVSRANSSVTVRTEFLPTRTQRIPNVVEIEPDSSIDQQDAEYYRNMAKSLFIRKREFLKNADVYRRRGDRLSANIHFQEAKSCSDLIEFANEKAAQMIFLEHNQDNFFKDTIDFHNLYVKEAILALDLFLNRKIQTMQEEDYDGDKQLTVITGRGKHSKGGISKIKPAVIKRLVERRLMYELVNPGLLEVTITQYSPTTAEM